MIRVGERYNCYGTRVLLEVDEQVCSLPLQWTDLVAPDPELVLGEGRTLLRVRDFMDLAGVVARLISRSSLERPDTV